MTETKYYCDYCGKECPPDKMMKFFICPKSVYDDFHFRGQDLCPECEKAVKTFMKTLKV